MINIKRADRISWTIAIIVINNIIWFTPNFGPAYFAMIVVASAVAILNASFRRVDFCMLCLYLSCIISIIGNDIPGLFRPWQRFAAFILVTQLISPFLKSEYLWYIRLKTFSSFQKLLEFVVIGSMIAYFIGQGMGRGGFVGITTQAMVIAPMSANVVLGAIFALHYENSNKKKIYYIIVLTCAFLCLLMAASRTAIIATVIGAFIYVTRSNYGEIGKFTKFIMGILIAMLVLYPLWSPYLENVQKKNEGSISSGGMTSSRDAHWQQRMVEWKSSPIIGIGFASVSTDVTKKEGATFDPITGSVEPGTSWLAALSMTGILGFISLLGIFFYALKDANSYTYYNKKYAAYIASLVVFWGIHMIAEGYIFAGGSYMFFNVWLVIGVADALNNYEHVIRAVTPDDEVGFIEYEVTEETEEYIEHACEQ